MIARFYGVPPWTLADVPADWLAVADTIMASEAGAASEIRLREQRKARQGGGGTARGLGRR